MSWADLETIAGNVGTIVQTVQQTQQQIAVTDAETKAKIAIAQAQAAQQVQSQTILTTGEWVGVALLGVAGIVLLFFVLREAF